MLNFQLCRGHFSLVEIKLLAEVTNHFIEDSAKIFIKLEFILNSYEASRTADINSGSCLLSLKEVKESDGKMRNNLGDCHSLLLEAKDLRFALCDIAILNLLHSIDNS